MDGDAAPFNVGEADLPTVQAEPAEIVRQIVQVLEYVPDHGHLEVNPGCARRESEDLWVPLVMATLGEATWRMSPATARAVAVHISASTAIAARFRSAAEVGMSFTTAADTAEALAAGDQSFVSQKELN